MSTRPTSSQAKATVTIRQLNAEELTARLAEFGALLQDAVDSGASIGFLRPLGAVEAQAYWSSISNDLAKTSKSLLVAEDASGAILGTVQLTPAGRANAPHRAEVQKLMVQTAVRGQGLARQLMQAVEQVALSQQFTLLVLDTVQGDTAEQFYPKIGYQRVGSIPNFVCDETGALHATVIFYKWLAQ